VGEAIVCQEEIDVVGDHLVSLVDVDTELLSLIVDQKKERACLLMVSF